MHRPTVLLVDKQLLSQSAFISILKYFLLRKYSVRSYFFHVLSCFFLAFHIQSNNRITLRPSILMPLEQVVGL